MSNDENKPRTIEERLMELMEWKINPEIKIAYRRFLSRKHKYLEGELVEVYQDGYREWIYGPPRRKKFKTPTESCSENTALFDVVKRESDYQRAMEVMEDRKIVKEVELHVIGKLEQPEPMKVYIFYYPSRYFLKLVNPKYPEKYEGTDDQIPKLSVPEDEKRLGARRKTTRSRKTDQ